jgi:hypothetical protein
MEIVKPKQFVKKDMQQTVVLPNPREAMTNNFTWLLYKPQAHAVTPFQTNMNTREANSIRR